MLNRVHHRVVFLSMGLRVPKRKMAAGGQMRHRPIQRRRSVKERKNDFFIFLFGR